MSAVSMVPPSRSTSRLGRYDIVGPLATGGMAEILLGKLRGPSGFERAVVVKRILPHYASQREFVSMFLDEGRIAARLQHPNVVQVHELSEESGELFLVMEYLQGESLAGLMRRAKVRGVQLDPALVAFVLAEACAGLNAAHDLKNDAGVPMGLVHRDVSPQNVFVTYHGAVKILDFGIAKAADRITQTEAGALKGKYEYMSPEQALGERIDRRSDVFSLGVVLYELLTGARLFRRSTPLATLRAVTDDPIVPPREVRGCPAALDRICMKALARSVDQRYATAAEMRRDLLAFVRSEGPDGPGEALGALLTELFGDRIRVKEELLQNLAQGADVGPLPDADVDASVELPEVISIATRPSPVRAKRAEASDARGPTRWPLALGALALAAPIAWLALRPTEPALPTPTTSAAPADEVREEPAGPTTIAVTLETDPPGALVTIAGVERGATPLRVELPHGAEPLEATLSLEGYVTRTRPIVPDVDQRVELTLEEAPLAEALEEAPRATPRARRPREPATEAPAEVEATTPPAEATPEERRFRRFD